MRNISEKFRLPRLSDEISNYTCCGFKRIFQHVNKFGFPPWSAYSVLNRQTGRFIILTGPKIHKYIRILEEYLDMIQME